MALMSVSTLTLILTLTLALSLLRLKHQDFQNIIENAALGSGLLKYGDLKIDCLNVSCF